MRRVIEVPSEVRAKALALGGPGQRWLAGLAEVIEGLERDWDLTVGATLRGGSEAYVAEATTGDGEPAILKLALPGEWVSHEIETLLHARGRGYVRLLRHDESRQAMLLERLGTSALRTGPACPRPTGDHLLRAAPVVGDACRAGISVGGEQGCLTG